jgi:two-component system OmpR family sensor kinase
MAMSAGRIGQAWKNLRGLPDRTPLRVKLITAVLALVAIALAVISVAGISVISNYLLNQYDTTLQSGSGQAQRAIYEYLQGANPNYSNQTALIWIPAGGKPQVVLQPYAGFAPYGGPPSQGQLLSGPQVPDSAAWLAANNDHELTLPAQSGGGRWRVLVEAIGTATGTGTMIYAVNVTSAYSAISQLTSLDLIVSAVLLFGILVVGIGVVRASLRPLTDIEQTAGAIAAGDLTRRVPDRDPRTEVGRLGRSLNVMLAQIEAAFDARAESELAARRSEERMRQFVADASHELRTPLTAIRGFAEYYRQRGGVAELPAAADRQAPQNGTDSAVPEADTAGPGAVVSPRHGSNGEPDRAGPLARADLDRIMQRVEQEASRMGVLVEDMLLLARLDQQRPLEQRTVDMLTLAADAVHDARVVAPDRSINLTVGAGAALLVLGDEVRLRQVIGNLMSNALNHTPEGTPIEVRVRLGSLDEWRAAAAAAGRRQPQGARRAAVATANPNVQPVPAVVFEVADQGPGLTPSQAEHVFERFYRVDRARTRQSGGAGLGLSIVAALVAAHGGTVWVESPPGGGAIFRIAVPLAPEARHSGPDLDDGTDPDIQGIEHSHRPLAPPPAAADGGNGAAVPPGSPEPTAPAEDFRPAARGKVSYPARPGTPPLPKRRPGLSGHART